jgi:hypothetical protein
LYGAKARGNPTGTRHRVEVRKLCRDCSSSSWPPLKLALRLARVSGSAEGWASAKSWCRRARSGHAKVESDLRVAAKLQCPTQFTWRDTVVEFPTRRMPQGGSGSAYYPIGGQIVN